MVVIYYRHPTTFSNKYISFGQGPKGQKIGPVQIVCQFMVTYIKTFNRVIPLI